MLETAAKIPNLHKSNPCMIAIIMTVLVAAVLLLHGCQSLGGTSIARGEPVTKLAFSPSLSGPLAITSHQRGALPPGSGSGYGTLLLAYVCRRPAIYTSPSQMAERYTTKVQDPARLA